MALKLESFGVSASWPGEGMRNSSGDCTSRLPAVDAASVGSSSDGSSDSFSALEVSLPPLIGVPGAVLDVECSRVGQDRVSVPDKDGVPER